MVKKTAKVYDLLVRNTDSEWWGQLVSDKQSWQHDEREGHLQWQLISNGRYEGQRKWEKITTPILVSKKLQKQTK